MTESDDLLNIRPLRRRLKEGKEALGMWLGITDPLAVEAIAADCDLDWILLDMEHGGAGWDDPQDGDAGVEVVGRTTVHPSSVA